jgi:NAD(P)-dependent dehydrogenase (short-subunit alcohol dehydrogenase family)
MRILVVGATGTIGRAVADALDGEHDVIRASRNGDVTVDMTDPSSIRAMYEKLGRVDGVIVCAGGGVMKPLTELVDGDIEATLNDKLMGQVNLVRFGIDHMNDGGIFLLTAGIFSQSPPPGVTAVAMVNGALESFSRGAALDLPRGLRINTVSPPFIEETARALGMEGGLPAAENAKVYVELVESERTGEVVYPADRA